MTVVMATSSVVNKRLSLAEQDNDSCSDEYTLGRLDRLPERSQELGRLTSLAGVLTELISRLKRTRRLYLFGRRPYLVTHSLLRRRAVAVSD